MTIRRRMTIGFAIIIAGTLLLGTLGYLGINRIVHTNMPVTKAGNDLLVSILGMRRAEKNLLNRERTNADFFATGESFYLDEFEKNYESVQDDLIVLNSYETKFGGSTELERIKEIETLMTEYREVFRQTVELILEAGYKDYGRVGDLRAVIRSLETELSLHNGLEELQIHMLTCRRYEKDYLLRKDLNYQANLNDEVLDFLKTLESAELPEETKTNLKTNINNYRNLFNETVNLDLDIGHTVDDGLTGEFRRAVMAAEELIKVEILTVFDQTEAYAETIYLRIIVMALLVTLLSILFAVINIRQIVGAINKVVARLTDIAEGEGDLTIQLAADGNSEMDHLASQFNTFTGNLRMIIGRVKESSEGSLRTRDDLSANAEQTSASLSEINGEVITIEKSMVQMKDSMESSADISKKIISNISDLDSQIRSQASAVEESSASVTEMIASLGNLAGMTDARRETLAGLIRTAGTGEERLKATAGAVDEINSSMDGISRMMQIINGIAAQTNLLAMNAAIEAAHAGDAGRGFAVVANEIRSLAESTSVNAKDISSLIKEIMEKITTAADGSHSTQTAFGEINSSIGEVEELLDEIINSTQELSAGGEEITRAMSLLSDVTAGVSENSGKMETRAREMGSAFRSASEVSREVQEGITRIAGGTGEIASAMEEVGRLSEDMSEHAENLNDQVNRFKT